MKAIVPVLLRPTTVAAAPMQRALTFVPFNPPASGDSRWLTNGSPATSDVCGFKNRFDR